MLERRIVWKIQDLCEYCVTSTKSPLCLCSFFLGSLASSHSPKTCTIRELVILNFLLVWMWILACLNELILWWSVDLPRVYWLVENSAFRGSKNTSAPSQTLKCTVHLNRCQSRWIASSLWSLLLLINVLRSISAMRNVWAIRSNITLPLSMHSKYKCF